METPYFSSGRRGGNLLLVSPFPLNDSLTIPSSLPVPSLSDSSNKAVASLVLAISPGSLVFLREKAASLWVSSNSSAICGTWNEFPWLVTKEELMEFQLCMHPLTTSFPLSECNSCFSPFLGWIPFQQCLTGTMIRSPFQYASSWRKTVHHSFRSRAWVTFWVAIASSQKTVWKVWHFFGSHCLVISAIIAITFAFLNIFAILAARELCEINPRTGGKA